MPKVNSVCLSAGLILYTQRMLFSMRSGWCKWTRYDYGEPRFVLLGMVQERLLSLVYTPRGSVFRIISARKANARERKRYDSYQDQS